MVAEDQWAKLNEIIVTLEIPYKATKSMQSVGYGLADFFISWLRIKRSLDRLSEGQLDFAHRLKNAIYDRENLLLDTPTMMLAMYLDPRIKGRLNTIQKECAIISLEKLHMRLINAKYPTVTPVANDTLDELNAETFESRDDTTSSTDTDIGALRKSCTKYDVVKPANIKSSVLDFWRDHKEEFPLLYELACIVHAVHAGQCCVERNFSAFQYVRDSRRCKLLPQNMSNILMIRLNKDVHESWKLSQIAQLKEGDL